MVSYPYSRLAFKAQVIESLGPNDAFKIVTPDGKFQMTKKQFYDVFNNVVKTKSYRLNGVYHYPIPPQKSLQFFHS